MILNEFLKDKENLKWILKNKIFTWQIKKTFPIIKDGEEFTEICDGVMKRVVTDKITSQKYVYELIIPSFNCNTMFFGPATGKSDKLSYIPIFYNIFNDILEKFIQEKLPKEGKEERLKEIVKTIKEEFESCNGVWKNEYLSSSLAKR